MNKKILSLGATFILGLLMFLLGLNVFNNQAGNIVIGVFCLVFGILYVLLGLFTFVKTQDDFLKKLCSSLSIALYPLYMIVTIIVAMSMIGGDRMSASDYIIYIVYMGFGLLASVIVFVSNFTNNKVALMLLEIGLVGFLACNVLSFVFPLGGGIGTLANLSLLDLVLFGGYLLLSIDSIKDRLMGVRQGVEKALNEEPAKEEKTEESVVQEEPVADEQQPEAE